MADMEAEHWREIAGDLTQAQHKALTENVQLKAQLAAKDAEIADLRFELKVRDFMDQGHVRYNAIKLAKDFMDEERQDG